MEAEEYITEQYMDKDECSGIIEKLDQSFQKKTLKRAKFSEDGFKSVISDFSQFDVLNVSKLLTTKLKNEIKNIAPAKGGYLIFCRYTVEDEFFAVFIVRNTKSEILKHKKNNGKQAWDINSTEYLDSVHFAMGARINLSILNNANNQDRYISLSRGTTDISKFFDNWIGLDDAKQETKDADALYDLSNNIHLPSDVSRDEFKKKIFDYAKIRGRKPINLRDLSKHLYDDENTISKYCHDKNIDIDGEFKLSKKNRDRFYKISVKSGDIELTADRASFSGDNGITISNDGKSVIIKSEDLAAKIRERLDS